MLHRYHLCNVLALLAYLSTTAAVELSCANNDDRRYCIGNQIQHQCTIPGGSVTLRWRVLDDGGTQLGLRLYGTGSPVDNPEIIPGAGNFTTVVTANGNPLISNISFTASLSQNSHVIWCDEVGEQSENCSIIIADPPSQINNLMMSSCTSTSVLLSWTDDSLCITNYIINSTTSDSPITTSTSDTSYTLDISSLSVGVYYISVAGVDTGSRTGQHSNIVSVTIDVPPTVNYNYTLYDGEGDTAIIELSWTVDEVCPPISSYYITSGDTTISVPSSTTTYTIYGVSNGTSVTVFAGNAIGNGTKVFEIIDISDEPLPPLPTPSSSTATTPTTAPPAPTNPSGLSTGAIAGIIVGVIIGLVLAVVVVMVIVYIIYKVSSNKNSTKPDDPQSNYADLEMSNKSSSKKASKKKQQAPPQDTSAVVYSDVSHTSKPNNSGNSGQTYYADLDLKDNTPEPKSKPRNVQYADIRQQQQSS